MTRKLWGLVLAAVAIRAAAALMAVVIFPDGSRYVRMAQQMGQSRFGEALAENTLTHPLYPLLIVLGDAFLHNRILVGALLSAVLGGLAVLPLFFLFRDAWNDRVAGIAGLFYAFLPVLVELHSEVMLEGTFMFFFFSTMALGMSALERRSWEGAILTGVCAAAAWLTRPEGIYLPLLFGLACTIRRSRFAPVAFVLFLATAFLVAWPYLSFIRAKTGHWGITANEYSSGVVGLFTGKTAAAGFQVNEQSAAEYSEYKDIALYGSIGGPVMTLSKSILKILYYGLAPFLLLGFWFVRWPGIRWGPALHLFAGALGYFIPPVLAFVAGTPYSYRYILVPCILVLPVAAIGLPKAAEWSRRREALPVALAVLCLAMSARLMRFRRADRIGLKQAGLAIREKLGEGRRILGWSRPVETYALGEFVDPVTGLTAADLDRTVREKKVEVLALYLTDLRFCEKGFLEHVDKSYALFGEFPSPPVKGATPVRVYVTGLR